MRLQAERREVERMAGSAQPALNFVGNQERARSRARLRDRRGERRRERTDAAFALYRLGDDRGGGPRHRRGERLWIVDRHELHARQQRFERLAIVRIRRDRERPERTAVERFFERDEFGARLAFRVPVAAREFQAGFHRFRAAVAEKRARQTRQLREMLGELTLIRVIKEIRRVQQRLRLVGDRPRQTRMRMSQRRDADARQEVEVLTPVGVVAGARPVRGRVSPHCGDTSAAHGAIRAQPHRQQPSSFLYLSWAHPHSLMPCRYALDALACWHGRRRSLSA